MIYSQVSNREKIESLLGKLRSDNQLQIIEYKELLERTHSFLLRNSSNDNDYNLCLSVICHVGDKKPNDILIRKLLDDCIIQSRVFLYKDMLDGDLESFSNHDLVAQEFYTLDKSNTVLTRDQKKLYDIFIEHRKVIVSAPTSFGKSRIVQELIIDNDYSNILIVLPTIALLNETFTKLKGNSQIIQKYKVYNSLGSKEVRYDRESNIFILTPEKADILLDRHIYLKFNFFIMDEIYKVQDKDDRGKVFTNCLYRLSRIPDIHFYLIGPYFMGFSNRFIDKTQSKFIRFESEIVQKDNFTIDEIPDSSKFIVDGKELKKLKSARSNLKNIFGKLDGQSIIYHGRQKYSTESTAKYLANHGKRKVSSELIDYISENISKEWSLVNCIKAGIAFHHGALPKYIQTEIIDMFNNSELDAIVCTSTIIEGVNTTAKNVIIYDQFKGPNELTGFDVKNIKGRAGRFLNHFIGNIYSMVPLKKDQNKDIIDFSFYDNEHLDGEDILQIDKEDLSNENLKTRLNIEKLLQSKNIPIDVIKANKFLPIFKQLSLIDALRSNLFIEELLFSSTLPTSEQLDRIMDYCFEHLFTDYHKDNQSLTIANLKRLTKYYIFYNPTTKQLISEFSSENIDTRIRNAFSLISEYFEFALPKYLTAFENLFNFVIKERNSSNKLISFSYLITKLEFGQSEEHEIAMKEAGLPNDIIKKVSDMFKDCSTLQEIRYKFTINPHLIKYLSAFEQKIFKRYI